MHRSKKPISRPTLHSSALVALLLGLTAACTPTSSPELKTVEAGSGLADRPAANPTAPHIVLILADDLGLGDVSAYAHAAASRALAPPPVTEAGAAKTSGLETPNIDRIAQLGLLMKQGYVTHPVCSPSRAGLMTGRYQQRHGFEFNIAGRDIETGLDLSEATLANRLQNAGYLTRMIGKWHLGKPSPYLPINRGFDSYYGVLEGGTTFWNKPPASAVFASLSGQPIESNRLVSNGKEGPQERKAPIWRMTAAPDPTQKPSQREVRVDGYLTDDFTREAVQVIEQHPEGNPLFLYLAYTAPHTPLQATREDVEAVAHLPTQRARVYGAMVRALDRGVGEVTEALKERGLYENTLLIFLSDNGCAGYLRAGCSNAPFSGFKRYFHEGGVRVPFFMQWPNTFPAGAKFSSPVSSLDLTPTLLAAAGARPEEEALDLDGQNLLPYLTGKAGGAPHETLHWRAGPSFAIRSGNLKLIRLNRSKRSMDEVDNPGMTLPLMEWSTTPTHGQLTLLYDLEADPEETVNLAAERPADVERLVELHSQWEQESSLVAPQWAPRRSTLAEFDQEVVQLFY